MTAGSAWLAVVGLLGSVISFGYYGAVLRAVWLDEAADDETEESTALGEASHTAADSPAKQAADPRTRAGTAVVLLVAVAVIAIGVAPLVLGGTLFDVLAR